MKLVQRKYLRLTSSRPIMNFQKISSRVFSFICFLGFLIQVEQVSELYFSFETRSRTMYQIREADYYQTIMYCPRFADLIDKSAMNNDHNTSLSRESTQQYLRDLHLMVSKLTIKEILELTPLELHAIQECDIRRRKMSNPTYLKKKQCDAFFRVIKSVNGERICYTFIPKTRAIYSVGSVATSLNYLGVVYQIIPNPYICNSVVAIFISSSFMTDRNGSLKDPLHSRPFVAKLYNINSFNHSRFLVYGESIEIHRLPPPYDTRCALGHDQEVCQEECLIEKLKAIDRMPWSAFHREKLDVRILSSVDLERETVSNYTENSFEECLILCKQKNECLTRFSRTTVEQYQAETCSISSMLPSLPHMLLHAVPSLNTVEYIIQLGSCFGMWFGLSIISFNPVKWKAMQKKDRLRVVINTQGRLFKITKTTAQQQSSWVRVRNPTHW